MFDIARFDGKWYIAAGSTAESKVYLFIDPVEQLKSTKKSFPSAKIALKMDNPRFVSFSGNARFLAVQSGATFALYDAETERSFKYDDGLATPVERKALWMDGHRLVVNKEQKVNVFDFDGTNLQQLSATNDAAPAVFDKDYKAMFTVAPSAAAGTVSIDRTELKVTQ